MAEQFANHPGTTLAAPITSTARPATVVLTSSAGLPGSASFRLLIENELLLVSAVLGANSFTASTVEGTVAATHASGVLATHILTAGALLQLEADVTPAAAALTEATSSVLNITGGATALLNPVSIQVKQASGSQPGYLASADWTAFNAKQSALGFTPLNPANNLSEVTASTARTNLGLTGAATATPAALTEATSSILTIAGGSAALLAATTITVAKATTSVSGYLSSTDWTTFNAKQAALTLGNLSEATSSVLTITGATGAIIGSGLSIQVKQASASASGYLSSTDWNAFNTGAGGAATALQKANNLSDLASATTARTNLGLGSAATTASSAYDAAGAATAAVAAIPNASASATGLLTSGNWTTFNAKQAALTLGNLSEATSSVLTITGATGAIIGSGLTIQVKQASGSQPGYLASADWSTFNAKQAALGFTPLNPANNLSDVLLASTARQNLAASGQLYINVKDAPYNAKGDGSTNDTSAISSAISAANTAGGGTVFFPPGTYITGTQLLYTNVNLLGAGEESTILKLAAGTNGDLLQGSVTGYTNGINGYTGTTALVNLAAAKGTGNNSGISGFSIRSLTIDGNYANQTAYGCGIRLYGYGYRLMNLYVRNCYGDGIYNDWNPNTANFSLAPNQLESQLNTIKVHDIGYSVSGSTSMGIRWGGGTDSQWDNIVVYKTACHCVHIGPNGSATQITNLHGWAAGAQAPSCTILVEGGSYFTNCEAEGASVANVALLCSGAQWMGGRVFPGSSLVSYYGFQLGQASGDTAIIGAYNQTTAGSLTNPPSSGAGTTYTASGLVINTAISDTFAGAFHLRSEHNNSITALCYQTYGSAAPASAPALSSAAAGSLAAQTYYVKTTYTNARGETLPSAESSLAVAINHQLVVTAPTGYGSSITGWNVYISNATGTEKLQSSGLSLSSNYTQTTTLSTATAAVPVVDGAGMLVQTGNSSFGSAFASSDGVSINANGIAIQQQGTGYGSSGSTQITAGANNIAFGISNGNSNIILANTSAGYYNENAVQLAGSSLSIYSQFFFSSQSWLVDHNGAMYFTNSGIVLGTNPAAQTLSNSSTVTVYANNPTSGSYPINNYTYHYGKVRVTAASAVTGLAMQASISGSFSSPKDGTQTTVVNESAYTLTFAASGSNVSIPSFSIPAYSAQLFTFNAGTGFWHPQGAQLTVTNDTNVTGSVAGGALTLGWAGTLAAARLNTSVVQAITNDTNITGSITAQNLTLGFTGQLSPGRGGTGASSLLGAGIPTLSSANAFTANNTFSGNVGIGTSSPNATFSLGPATGVKALVYDASSTYPYNMGFGTDLVSGMNSLDIFMGYGAGSNTAVNIAAGKQASSYNYPYTTYTAIATFLVTGNVGIGNTNPGSLLTVGSNLLTVAATSGNTAVAGTLAVTGAATFNGAYNFVNIATGTFANSSGTPTGGVMFGAMGNALNEAVAVGAECGRFELTFPGFRDIATNQVGSKIVCIRRNNYLANQAYVQSSDLVLFTGPGGGSNSGITDTSLERLRINGVTGYVGIGTVGADPAALFSVGAGSLFTVTSSGLGAFATTAAGPILSVTQMGSSYGVGVSGAALYLNTQNATGSATYLFNAACNGTSVFNIRGDGNTAIAGTLAVTGTATFTAAPVFTDQSNSRLALGLGTAATQASSAFDASGAASTAQAAAISTAETYSSNAGNLTSGTVSLARGGTGVSAGSAQAAIEALTGTWQTWTPTLNGTGSMTVSAPSSVTAKYLVVGYQVYFRLQFTTTVGGTTNAEFTVNLPFTDASGIFYPCVAQMDTWTLMLGFVQGSTFAICMQNAASYATGSHTFICNFVVNLN